MGFFPAALVGSQLLSNPVTVGQGGTGATTAAGGLTALGGLVKQAATAVAGYSLINGTGNIITWTTPNDAAQHRVLVLASQDVTAAETGGLILVTYNSPDGGAASHTLFPAGQATGVFAPASNYSIIVEANTTVVVTQNTALTVGTAVLWAEIWGL